MTHDVVTVGGGLGGAALAWCLAKAGMRVVVLEREKAFKDRVRGEGLLPWGVNEARDLGLYSVLEACGHPVRYWTSHSWSQRPPRDLLATTPRAAPCLNFYHPTMQEAVLAAAAEAGAEVRRGVQVRGVEPGSPPRALFSNDGVEERIQARLVVGADGRESKVRRWAGFSPWRAEERLVISGALFEGLAAPDDSVHVFRNSEAGEGGLFFPLGDRRVRCYFIYRKRGERRGLSGPRHIPEFIQSCCQVGVPQEWFADAQPAGPLAEFEGADTWVKHPYQNRVALVGDAASSNDPTWGNGLSLTIRDVRALSECLLRTDDWEEAGRQYASQHDQYFGAIHRVTTWLTELMYEIGPEADARRARAFPLMQSQKRTPDFIALGPASPSDEAARRLMFGEE